MTRQVRNAIVWYAVADFLSASLVWILFLAYRKLKSGYPGWNDFATQFSHKDLIMTLCVIPFTWLILHLFSGAYFNPFRKSRFIEIYRSFIITLIGSLLVFFVFILNDTTRDVQYYTQSFLVYLLLQFCITVLIRILVLNQIKRQMTHGQFGYNTLLIGGNQQAIGVYKDLTQNKNNPGYQFNGFVYADATGNNGMSAYLPKLGSIENLENIIDEHAIEEVIIAVDTSEHDKLQHILAQLSHRKIIIKITPDLYDIISGTVKTSNVFGAVLIEIYPELMPDWQRVIKRAIDIAVSSLVLILLSPLYLFAALQVKRSSPGPVLYKQWRIGLNGKPFYIYKFRSMVVDAEEQGPALSSAHDPRITRFGKFMRKWRIDELPQFYNIIIGDMSLVGPRPERKHYIDIISQTHPHYKYLHKVKPGLSSWGMVKFGYAENTSQMIERMKYDLLYIRNCSLVLDFKIMIYTILVILQGRGK